MGIGWGQCGQAAVSVHLAQHWGSWDFISWDREQYADLTLSIVQCALLTVATPGEGSGTLPKPHLKCSCAGVSIRNTHVYICLLLFFM